MVLVGVEDIPGEAIARRLIAETGFDLRDCDFVVERGSELKRHLARYLSAAKRRPAFVLPDLDEAVCAPSKVADWIAGRVVSDLFMLRVAVREVESWILADRVGFHRFFRVPLRRITTDPDSLPDPKEELLRLVLGAPAAARRGFVRTESGRVLRDVLYNAKLKQFVSRQWSYQRAAPHSISLAKAYRALLQTRAAFDGTVIN